MKRRDVEGGYLTSVKDKQLVRYKLNSLNVKHNEFMRGQNEDPHIFDFYPVDPVCFS